jgi:DNA-binding CsgD family transcriptional regulator
LGRSAEDPAAVANLFHAAAVGHVDWNVALSALATLTGSFTGELIGFGKADALTFYCQNAIAPQLIEEFKAARGYDPSVNSRMRIGLRARPLEVLDEHDFTTALDMERHPEYGAYLRKADAVHICLTSLLREDGTTVGLSVLRTQAQGHISAWERRAFAEIAPHVRCAAQTYLALESRQLSLVADTFERIAACAFVCNANGSLRAMSKSAEALVRDGSWLSTRENVLVARTAANTRRLHNSLHAAAIAGVAGSAPPLPFAIRDGAGVMLPLEATPYFGTGSDRRGSLVILLAKPPRDLSPAASQLARSLFQLTDKEAVIAAELTRGRTVAEIAEASGSAIGTVRVHLRNIFVKMGVSNQAQVVAKLCSYR